MATPKKPNNAPPPCPACGQVHERDGRATCAHHKSRKGPGGQKYPCLQWGIDGTDPLTCRTHGASTKAARAKAAERVQARELAAAVERHAAEARTLGLPVPVGDPKQMLLDLIGWSAGHVEFYRAQVQALTTQQVVQGTRGVQRVERTGFQAGSQMTTDVGPEANIWLVLYNQERDRLQRLIVDAARLKIDEDRVRVEQQAGARIAEGFMAVQRFAAARFALDAAAVDELRSVLRDVLAALASGDPFPVPAIPGEVVEAGQ